MIDPAYFFHLGAFVGYVKWASGDAKMIDRFQSDTGVAYRAPRTGLDAAIDKATGYNSEIARRFTEWCANDYGRQFLPENFMEILTEKPNDNGRADT